MAVSKAKEAGAGAIICASTGNTSASAAALKYKNEGEFYEPTATGFGISYVIPIVVQALVASTMNNSVLIIENPEAHLHPYSQSQLGKFLTLVALNGVQIIVETHSEHIYTEEK